MHSFSGSHNPEPDTSSILAADMGTTNIVVSCGNETVRIRNPQTRYGSDIISRILFSMNGGGSALTAALHKGLFEAFSLLYEKIQGRTSTAKTGTSPFPLNKMVLTGNTVMMHFLAGLETYGMASYPFTAVSLFNYECKVSDIFPGIDFSRVSHLFSPEASVYLPPCIEAFAGGDLVCAAAGCFLYGQDPKLPSAHLPQPPSRLLIDIGTNTEILLFHKNDFFACSASAGPAFEGGKVKSSLRGSELLHALHLMLSEKQMDNTGMVLQEKTLLCQADIRQLQLAKAAICAAVETLLHEAHASSEDIDEVFLCGAFGIHILPADIEASGLLNKVLSERITIKESAVIEGAFLLSQSLSTRKITSEQVKKTKIIQLPNNGFFAAKYIDSMNF